MHRACRQALLINNCMGVKSKRVEKLSRESVQPLTVDAVRGRIAGFMSVPRRDADSPLQPASSKPC